MKFLQSFFLGILGAIGALFLEIIFLAISLPLSSNPETISRATDSIGPFFFLAILAEEFLKYLLIYRLIAKTDERKDIVLSSFFFGFGFSLLEIFLVYWNYRNGSSLDFIGLLGIIIIHVSTAVLIGYSASKNKINFISSIFLGLIPAIMIHSAYNILKITGFPRQKELTVVLLVLLVLMDVFLLFKSRKTPEIETS